MTDERFNKAGLGVWVGVVCNIALAVMEGLVGFLSGSKVLVADALHSAANAAGLSASWIRGRAAKHPLPDGHSRTKAIAAITVSILLLLLGLECGMYNLKAIYAGIDAPPAAFAFVAVIISIIVKEMIFWSKYRLGGFSRQALFSNPQERRFDACCSIAVLVGVGGAWAGHYLGNIYLYYLDPLAGLFIAAVLIRMGYVLLRDVLPHAADTALRDEDAAELLRTVQTVKGVIAVDELKAREHGHYVIIDVKISVNPRISVLEGHDVARYVKQILMKRFTHVSDVFIQVHPYDPGYPYKNNVDPEHDDHPSLLH
ncbi:cation diffusion facilitator family transporter [Paenibacillus piri]|uniref:Cation transporter n=1 Tax=Paenibacillus piri TaxID=2547395 RepID=A0A4R5KPQ7_9BACL|nr:cation diffusion facilitator family transporter [Paenibacillus piri]TDF97671.1 cation transporter [Paenibacillus piri]